MLLINCPYCDDALPELEFAYAGEAHIARPENIAAISDEEFAEYFFLRDSLGGVNQPGIIALTEGVIPIVIFSTVSHIILRVVLYCCHQAQRHHAYAYQRLSHPPAAGGRQKEF